MNEPAKIYLQVGEDYSAGHDDFRECEGVTHCDERIHKTDIEYVRRDVVLEAMAALCERSDVAESSLLKLDPHRDEIMRHIINAAIKEAEAK